MIKPYSSDETKLDSLLRNVPSQGLALVSPNSVALKKILANRVEHFAEWGRIAGNEPAQGEALKSFSEFLADTIGLPDSRPEFLTHFLNRWSESGAVLWVWVKGENLAASQLNSLLSYSPLSPDGHHAIRIVLELDQSRLESDTALQPLYTELKQRDLLGNQSLRSLYENVKPKKKILVGALGVIVLALLFVGIISSVSDDDSTSQVEIIDSGSSESGLSLTIQEKRSIEDFVAKWLDALANQNLGYYLGAYAASYTSSKDVSPVQWRINRIEQVKQPLWITIEYGPTRVQKLADSLYLVSYWQLQRTPDAEEKLQKELTIQSKDGRLSIIKESSIAAQD